MIISVEPLAKVALPVVLLVVLIVNLVVLAALSETLTLTFFSQFEQPFAEIINIRENIVFEVSEKLKSEIDYVVL